MRRTTSALLTVGLVCAVPAGARADADKQPAKAPEWSLLQTPFYHLRHDRAYEGDARKARKHLDRAIEGLREEFAGHPVDKLLRGIDCQVYLHPKANDRASEGYAGLITQATNGKYTATIHLLTPSAFRPDFRSSVGEPGGDDYFAKVLVHEYATILLERLTRAKAEGWRGYYDAPRWFVQGYEEYLGLTRSTPHNRKAVLAKYLALHKGDPGRVQVGFGIGVREPYVDGAVLLSFMHETFGKERVQAILTSKAPTFEGAVGPALGVTLEEFGRKWEEWRRKLP